MAQGIKESRWRFMFSGGSLSLPRTLPLPKTHHTEDALHPYIADQAFDRGVQLVSLFSYYFLYIVN